MEVQRDETNNMLVVGAGFQSETSFKDFHFQSHALCPILYCHVGMLQQHTTEKQLIVLSGIIYYLNPKNSRFPFSSKEKLRLSLKYGIWSFSLLVRKDSLKFTDSSPPLLTGHFRLKSWFTWCSHQSGNSSLQVT